MIAEALEDEPNGRKIRWCFANQVNSIPSLLVLYLKPVPQFKYIIYDIKSSPKQKIEYRQDKKTPLRAF